MQLEILRVSTYSGDALHENNYCPRRRFASRPVHLALERHHQCSGLLRERKRYVRGHSRRQSHFKGGSLKTVDEVEKMREAEETVKEHFMEKPILSFSIKIRKRARTGVKSKPYF
jgi:hypothetical protein